MRLLFYFVLLSSVSPRQKTTERINTVSGNPSAENQNDVVDIGEKVIPLHVHTVCDPHRKNFLFADLCRHGTENRLPLFQKATLVFGNDIVACPFAAMQISCHFADGKSVVLILFQRIVEKIFAVGFLYNLTALFQKRMINTQKTL